MKLLFRGFIAFVISRWILVTFSNANPGGMFWVIGLIVYLIVFPGGAKVKKTIRQERIMNLQNNTLGEVFVPSKYPEYTKQSSSKDGNDYISPSGAIICTKYVTKTKKKGSFGRHLFCIFIIMLVFGI
ncbi:MAG: hypothetical protein ACI4FY_08685 [Acetatifactor sp.]